MQIKLINNAEEMELSLSPLSGYIQMKIKQAIKALHVKKIDAINALLKTGLVAQYMTVTEINQSARFEKPNGKDNEGMSKEQFEFFQPILQRIEADFNSDYEYLEKLVICQNLIDTSKLNDENKAIIESEVTSDFWQNADPAEVAKAEDYFRTK